jgi:hypothetical protein
MFPAISLPPSSGSTLRSNCCTPAPAGWFPLTSHRLHDFSSVLNRLDRVDCTLERLSHQMDLLSSRSEIESATSTAMTNAAEGEKAKDAIVDEITIKEILQTENSAERLYGYPAALCLFRSSQKLLRTALGGCSNTAPPGGALARAAADRSLLRSSLVRHYEIFPFQGKCIEPPVTSDHVLISAPPLTVLESSIPCFLESINAQIPVFDDNSLQATIQTCYRANDITVSLPWAVCFNCIVILVWNLEARAAQRLGSPITDPWQHKAQAALLLANCRRALADLERFTRPTIDNLQALILLVGLVVSPNTRTG